MLEERIATDVTIRRLEAEVERLREVLQQCEVMLRDYESVGGDDEADGVYFLIRNTMKALNIPLAALKGGKR